MNINYYFKKPAIIPILLLSRLGRILSDERYLKLMFRLRMKSRLNLNDPKSFSEKLQWLKLYDRRPEYTTMVDKYNVKDYVANIIGKEYIIPTLGVWNNAEDINWDVLPDKFVLKCTHDSGTVLICKDKSTFDRSKAIRKLNKWLKRDYFKNGREWPYKNVPHRIIAEEFIAPAPTHDDLPDYKFFCFDGEVKALFVGSERQTGDVKFDFFDTNFHLLDFIQGHPHLGREIPKPKNFEKMIVLASKISSGIPQVRIDFYDTGTKIYFGEITFFHFSGFMPFEPEEWDYRFGSWIKLPQPTLRD